MVQLLKYKRLSDIKENYEEFNNVGIITGDVQVNKSAKCLVMTTEILRNMIYAYVF